MLRVKRLLGIVVLLATSAFAQSFPETDALLDAFLAKDLNAALRHLPPEWEKYIADLSECERKAITPRMLLSLEAISSSATFSRPEQGDVLLVEEFKPDDAHTYRIEFSLEKRISNGYESMLRLRAHNSEIENHYVTFQILLRFEEGEWRVYEIQQPYFREKIDFSTSDLLERARNSLIGESESAAFGMLQALSYQYSRYLDANAALNAPPPSADIADEGVQLESEAEEPAGEGLAPEFDITRSPAEKDGYRYMYSEAISTNSQEPAFTILARPIRFGQTGTINFFTDQSHVVRYTREDREASAEDPPFRSTQR